MAGKGGGGSWKVAYADFVTAMMAFFLVMWLGSQDDKVKQSVANYFIDPSGTSKKPVDTGAVLQARTHGAVPKADANAMGKGRNRQTAPGERSPETKLLTDYVAKDPKRKEYWGEQAKRMEDEAERTKEVREGVQTKEQMAAFLLSNQLRDEMGKTAGGKGDDLQAELLSHSLNGVNWTQLAEDLMDTGR